MILINPAFSPTGRIPDQALWDEPQLVSLIDSARDTIAIQLLTYSPADRDHGYYEVFENALRRAAGRGVTVQILLADWCKRPPAIDYLKGLGLVPGIEVRLMTIPEWSGGFIPFARVCHAKYMVVDGENFWIGTSNWSRDYFHNSRNVGLIGRGVTHGALLRAYFLNGWQSNYASLIRPEVEYEVPRISE